MSGHTELPWSLSFGFDTRGFGGEQAPAQYVAPTASENGPIGIKLATPWIEGAWDDDDEARANAEFIVRACNSHYDLLEALQVAAEELEYFVEFARNQVEFEGDADAGFAAVRRARTALSKALQQEGQSNAD